VKKIKCKKMRKSISYHQIIKKTISSIIVIIIIIIIISDHSVKVDRSVIREEVAQKG